MGKIVRLQQTLQELEHNQRVIVKNGEDTLYDGKAINAISTDLAYQYQVFRVVYEPMNDIYYIGVAPVEG